MSVISKFPHAGQRIEIEPMAVIRSPAFQAPYPPVRNLDLVIDGVRAAMEESWARGAFDSRDVQIFRLRGAYFSEECLVLDDQLRVVTNASDQYSDAEVDAAIGSIIKLLDENRLPHLKGPAVVAKRRAASNYGHFLMEMVPMAIIGRAVCQDIQPDFLLHRVQPEMLDAMLRAFRLLDVRPDRLHLPDFLEPKHFEDLIVVRGLTTHGTYMSPLCVKAVSSLASKVPPENHKRLFIKRRPGWQRGRRLINEAKIAARLEALGFRTIEPSELTLEQQIAEFSGAEDVIAVAGAALTNTVFCRPGARVVNLVSAHFPDTFFWFIATHRGLHYSEIRGDPASGTNFDTTSDFCIRDADVEWLEAQYRPETSSPAPRFDIVAHVQDVGDISVTNGKWAGFPGSRQWIEGFAMGGSAIGGIRYQALLERNWLSPWTEGGAFCGSRGMQLPIRGISIQLVGDLAEKYECVYNATFVDGTRSDGIPGGNVCQTGSFAPLEAFQVLLHPRA